MWGNMNMYIYQYKQSFGSYDRKMSIRNVLEILTFLIFFRKLLLGLNGIRDRAHLRFFPKIFKFLFLLFFILFLTEERN